MSRLTKRIGGVVTAVAVIVVLAFALLQPGSTPTSTSASPAPASSASGCTVLARSGTDGLASVCLADLPMQAQQTVALIDAGGPFPYEKDGSTFNNFEGLLPKKPKGYYREYTVKTPGQRDRGPRRIISGDHDRELFYTDDHYASFVRVQR